MSFTRIRLELNGYTALITLCDVENGNRIGEVMASELREAFHELDEDDNVRSIVLSGEGPDFCLGSAIAGPPSVEQMASHAAASAVAAVGKATFAALNGDALDQGLELALACDVRFATSGSMLGMTQVTSGVVPWDGGTQRLPRLIGRSRALEMLLSGRMVDGLEAAAMGLIVDSAQSGNSFHNALLAARVAETHGPLAVRYLKEAVYKGADLGLDQAMRMEADLATLLHSTIDRSEGLQAFAERRKPEFHGE